MAEATGTSDSGTGRALVLGGGGVTGVAWELGVLAGLAEAGVDLRDADLVVGTSAGSAVAAQMTTGRQLEELYAAQLAPPTGEISAKLGSRLMLTYIWSMVRIRNPDRYRAHMGAMALSAKTISEADRREAIRSRIPILDWPRQRLQITAIDARTGEFIVFDRDSGVSLLDAVGASCAVPGVWPPVTIGERRYIDGGIRSPANIDLAAGHDRVVVIAPITAGGGPIPQVSRQIAALGRQARVCMITPDKAAVAAIGRNVLDPARRAAAAKAGRAQAAAVAANVAAVWS